MLKINLKPNRDELVSKNQAVIDNLSQNFKQEKGEELREKKIATLQTEIETLQTEIAPLKEKEETLKHDLQVLKQKKIGDPHTRKWLAGLICALVAASFLPLASAIIACCAITVVGILRTIASIAYEKHTHKIFMTELDLDEATKNITDNNKSINKLRSKIEKREKSLPPTPHEQAANILYAQEAQPAILEELSEEETAEIKTWLEKRGSDTPAQHYEDLIKDLLYSEDPTQLEKMIMRDALLAAQGQGKIDSKQYKKAKTDVESKKSHWQYNLQLKQKYMEGAKKNVDALTKQIAEKPNECDKKALNTQSENCEKHRAQIQDYEKKIAQCDRALNFYNRVKPKKGPLSRAVANLMRFGNKKKNETEKRL